MTFIDISIKEEDDSVKAVYRGEWMLIDQDMSASLDGKKYNWKVSREIPAMTYYVDNPDDEDDGQPGSATWLPEKLKLGDMAKKAYDEAAEALIEAKGDPELVESKKIFLFAFQTPYFFTGTILAFTAYNAGAAAVRAVKAARKRAVARAKSGGRRGRAKKPHIPGWPAVNFRRGKGKGKGKKTRRGFVDHVERAAGEVDEPSSMKVNFKTGYKASFATADGDIVTLPAVGISVSVLDSDSDAVWETSDIYVPLDDSDELLVPQSVHVINAMTVLLAEAQAYVEFVKAEPDLTVTLE